MDAVLIPFALGVALVRRLDRETEQPVTSQRAPNARKNPSEIADIDEHVGRDDQVELIGLRVQKHNDVAFDEAVVEAAPTRRFEHVG